MGKIETYIERTKVPANVYDSRTTNTKDLCELYDVYESKGVYVAIVLAFRFGLSKGWRASRKAVKG